MSLLHNNKSVVYKKRMAAVCTPIIEEQLLPSEMITAFNFLLLRIKRLLQL